MPSPEEVVAGYQAAVAEVRRRVIAFAKAAWTAQGSYRDADVDALVAMIVPRVQAGQVQVANLTAAYISQVAALRTGAPSTPALVDRAAVTSGRGVAAEAIYRRPGMTVWRILSEGGTLADAVTAGAQRLESLVATDLQMAKVRQSDASMRRTGARFYRRVLTGGENCALCLLASTQRYNVGDLSPIHPGCDCSVDELPDGASDRVLDPDEVERIHERVADAFGTADRGGRAIDYRLISVREHGEYGPTLTWRGQEFTGPADVA